VFLNARGFAFCRTVPLQSEALINIEANRFRVDPKQSYVPKETRGNDPEVWGNK
jgi:hypothetical protein